MNTFRAPNSMNFQPDPLWSEWNQTQTEYPYDKYIHQLFEEKVTQFPEKVAVIFEDQQLTYQELNSKANQLANYLQTQGVEPESLVGIYLQRSLEMVVALLGVLKAGGTYVPLDPTFPPERLSYMMADAAPCVTLTQQSLLSDLQQIPQAEATILICLDQWEKISAPESGQNLNCVISASNLAYTIYTSGSTGKPKGVEITHGSVVNFLYSMARAPGINAQDILLAVTTISFDIAGLELYLPLSVGAQVVLASTEATSSPVLLEQLMQTHRVTIMQATPATWYLLLAAKWSGHPGLKILSGGELLPHALAHQLLERGACVWNLYGPTEATIWASVYQVKSLDESQFRENENAPEPIGYPIANTQLYVLDSSLRPVSMGVTGDLYISGVGLARGYRNQPELTQQKFIPNPFGQGRLYYTGDLARYLPDGNLQFLGRSDHQIKIRGFRIELGEIESVLNEHQGVHQSIVDIYEESSAQVPGGSKRLVAYIVPNSDYQVKATDNNFELQDEQVNQWGQLWDLAYTEQTFSSDPTFNISGWNDSYSGKPIPTPDMQEWLDGTVERILSCRPNRVLEIGCGTGMLLFRIAPQCTDYYGTDIALNALRYIHAQLERLEGDWSHVTLSQRPAHNFEGFEPETFDTVIINSVIQLFPSIDYLVDVVEKAVRVIRPGGTIFIGDVRNLALLEAFHASIQLYQAPESLPKSQLRQRIQKSLIQEGQLAINPEFFTTLQQYLPRISEVELQLRRGHFYNELTKFRYDVILYLDRDQSSATQPQWLNWQEDHLSLSKVRSSLIEEKPLLLGIKQVPNARLLSESKLMDLIKQEDESITASELRQSVQKVGNSDAINPEDWWALEEEFPYTVSITWSGIEAIACYDVIFQRAGTLGTPLTRQPLSTLKPWSIYANTPLQVQTVNQLEPELRQHLRKRLPDYMMPTAFVILKEFPLTPNKKVNRRALPAPERSRPELATSLVKPCSETEQIIAKIWQEVLQLEIVGVYDNFFDLGGNSLLITQVHNELMKHFGFDLSVVTLFQHPTIQALTKHLTQQQDSQQMGHLSKRAGQRTRQVTAQEQKHRRQQHRNRRK